jgi:hypothetical protein
MKAPYRPFPLYARHLWARRVMMEWIFWVTTSSSVALAVQLTRSGGKAMNWKGKPTLGTRLSGADFRAGYLVGRANGICVCPPGCHAALSPHNWRWVDFHDQGGATVLRRGCGAYHARPAD